MTRQKGNPLLTRDSSMQKILSPDRYKDSPSQGLRGRKNPNDMFKPPKPFQRPGSS